MNPEEKINISTNAYYKSPYLFFMFLQKYQTRTDHSLMFCDTIFDETILNISSYINLVCFRTFICELIHNAINLFPGISDYTFSFSNKRKLLIKPFLDFDEEGSQYFGQIIFDNGDKIGLNTQDIEQLYITNKSPYCNLERINIIIGTLYGYSFDRVAPTVITSYTLNKDNIKNATKK